MHTGSVLGGWVWGEITENCAKTNYHGGIYIYMSLCENFANIK